MESDRNKAIDLAKEIISKEPVFLDTETTGLGVNDEIIEVAVIDFNGEVLIDSLIRPSISIPREASKIHEISDMLVAEAPTLDILWRSIRTILKNRVVAIYNSEFDMRILKQSAEKHNIPWNLQFASEFCIMKLYADYYGDWNDFHNSYTWQSLEDASKQCGIDLPNTHRAKDDALLAREVLFHIADKMPPKFDSPSSYNNKNQTPEERELHSKIHLLQELEEKLANKELEISTIIGELTSFRTLYYKEIGSRIAELDRINARISELKTLLHPENSEFQARLKEAKEQAEESTQAYEREQLNRNISKFTPSDEIKSLFRDLAKKVHPDLAENEGDRNMREDFMKRVNQAYHLGDVKALLEIKQEWQNRPEIIIGEGIGNELIRVIRKIDQLTNRISTINKEIDEINNSELMALMIKVRGSTKGGIDLLIILADDIDNQIQIATKELAKVQKDYDAKFI